MIRAAGGVVVRDERVLLVHRARYDDWSLPKGKLEQGETWEQAALREVEEETGLRCELGAYIGASRYEVRGEPKEVRWWLMTSDGEAGPSNEVDAVQWATPDEARAVLSYEHERALVDAYVSRLRYRTSAAGCSRNVSTFRAPSSDQPASS